MAFSSVGVDVGELAKSPTAWGVAVLIALFVFWFYRDVRNPEKNASNAILTSMTQHTVDVFEMARAANEQTRQAEKQTRSAEEYALAAARSNVQCEQKISALVAYIRTLTTQLANAGVTPAPIPEDLLD